MNIVLTGSLGNIGKALAPALVHNGHQVTVITSKAERRKDIEALGATAAIGTFQDSGFLRKAFTGADAIYLMEAWEGIGSIFDKDMDFVAAFDRIAHNYKEAVAQSGVTRVVHLSSIGAHTDTGTGSLHLHHRVETILRQLPDEVAIRFMRPVGFFTNLFRSLPTIQSTGEILSTYGGDTREPWVSPLDIASAIVEEMESLFEGKTVRYIASDEVSPNEIARALGEAIGNPDLKWTVVPDGQMLQGMLDRGMNEWIADGFIRMQAAQRDGSLYEDFYRHKPALGKTKLTDFARDFAAVYTH